VTYIPFDAEFRGRSSGDVGEVITRLPKEEIAKNRPNRRFCSSERLIQQLRHSKFSNAASARYRQNATKLVYTRSMRNEEAHLMVI
jgi:hypothetical protein